jgi:peptidoglycan/xylan/chitin deacetylase (PgdA/CDA1 family)
MAKSKTIWVINGFLCGVLLLAVVMIFFGGWETTITLAGEKQMILEYGEEFQDPGASATFRGRFFLRSGKHVPVTVDASSLDTGELGTYEVVYSAGGPGASDRVTREIQVVDETPPTITLTHLEDYYTRPGHTYEEEGFTASDNYDGDLTDQVIRTETEEGVSYQVTDSSGNTTEVYREIVYDDREAPVITLEGEEALQVEKGEAYEEPGYTATDDCDGDLTAAVTVEETDGKLLYTVTDSYGNQGTAERTIDYVDTKPPVLTLSGDAEVWMKAGQTYVDPGFIAEDLGDGDLTSLVTVSGTVNQYHASDYELLYTVTDAAGNTATATRTVHVEPQPQPDVVEPGEKVVYLTFDDGPGAYTQELLDVLEEYNVKATFFVTGANAQYQDMIAKEAAAGHTVGIHSYSHNYNTVYASEDAYFEDVDKMQEIVEAETGRKTSLLRFPGGSSNTVSSYNPGIMTELTEDVEDMGYQYFDWNVSSGDAGETTDTETVAQNVISGMQQHKVSVVLQHDIKSFSVDAVEEILSWGIENGYTFLPLTSSSPTAHHGVNN